MLAVLPSLTPDSELPICASTYSTAYLSAYSTIHSAFFSVCYLSSSYLPFSFIDPLFFRAFIHPFVNLSVLCLFAWSFIPFFPSLLRPSLSFASFFPCHSFFLYAYTFTHYIPSSLILFHPFLPSWLSTIVITSWMLKPPLIGQHRGIAGRQTGEKR